MGDYQVGKRCRGDIIGFTKAGPLVYLEAGVFGTITEKGSLESPDIGQTVDVVVIENTEGKIKLAAASAKAGESPAAAPASRSTPNTVPTPSSNPSFANASSAAPAARSAAGNTPPAAVPPAAGGASNSGVPAGDGWDGWQKLPNGHSKAMRAMNALRKYAKDFLRELTDARSGWENERTNIQHAFQARAGRASEKFNGIKKSFDEQCSQQIGQNTARSSAVGSVAAACKTFLGSVSGSESTVDQAQADFAGVETARSRVSSAIDAKSRAIRELYDHYIANAQRVRDAEIDAAKRDQIDKEAQAEKNFNTKRKGIIEKYRNSIASGFSRTAAEQYRNSVLSTRFRGENYECRTEVPESIMLGNIGLTLKRDTTDSTAVAQTIEAELGNFVSSENGTCTVELPYAQRLVDGISLMIRYSPAERSFAQKAIEPLLLKLFLSFPASKLNATIIDPLELGRSFLQIPQLAQGPDCERIYDRRPWSDSKDIENALRRIRLELENMNTAYGTDRESRLKNETLRAIAITDFPNGFTDAALTDLHKIVRNSAATDVSVIICVNETELERLRSRSSTLVDEIMQSMVQTKVNGGKFIVQGNADESIYLRPDLIQDVYSNKDAIFGRFRRAIGPGGIKVDPNNDLFDEMFGFDISDSNNWFRGNHDAFVTPLGIRGANTVVSFIVGRTGANAEHHALIGGPTGTGKSALLHTFILSTMISYSPDEVQMYLLDFKEGVEFSIYSRYRLPSMRVVAINTEREFGLSILEELRNEFGQRSDLFQQYGVTDLAGYNKINDPYKPKVPRILLIIDEVQELFRERGENGADNITARCVACIGQLAAEGRSMGIHLVFASQDFRGCPGLENSFDQMKIRIVLKDAGDGVGLLLKPDNDGIKTLQAPGTRAGTTLYNNAAGAHDRNTFFRAAYMESEERKKLLEKMDAYFTDPSIAPLYKDYQTRVMLTSAENDVHNCFNRLIRRQGGDTSEMGHLPTDLVKIGKSPDSYGLMLGQGFGKKNVFTTSLERENGDNMLIATSSPEMGIALFELSALSLLNEELNSNCDKSNTLIYIVDLSQDDLSNQNRCTLSEFGEAFKGQVTVVPRRHAEGLLENVYEIVKARAEKTAPSTERIFLLFFGLDRARFVLQDGNFYRDNAYDADTPARRFNTILDIGPVNGVNCIAWGSSLTIISDLLGADCFGYFNKRIAYGLDENTMEMFVDERENGTLRGRTAVYMDVKTDARNTHFRPYEVPTREWVKRYAEAYSAEIDEGEEQ